MKVNQNGAHKTNEVLLQVSITAFLCNYSDSYADDILLNEQSYNAEKAKDGLSYTDDILLNRDVGF